MMGLQIWNQLFLYPALFLKLALPFYFVFDSHPLIYKLLKAQVWDAVCQWDSFSIDRRLNVETGPVLLSLLSNLWLSLETQQPK